MIHLEGNTTTTPAGEAILKKDLGYKYPEGLNLLPSSKKHAKILNKILRRAQTSYNTMSKYKDRWQDIDKVLRVYIPPKGTSTKKSSQTKEDNYADLIIPESYATMETILTYYMATFMQDPIIQYQGVGPEDVVGAKLMTHLINHQMQRTKFGLRLHTMFRDDTAYGFGVLAPSWRRIYGTRPKVTQYGTANDETGVFTIHREEKGFEEDVLLYEGNEVQNVNPYLYLPDVSVPIHEPEKGEYQGWVEETTFTNLMSIENDPKGRLFNVRYLKDVDARTIYTIAGDKQNTRDSFKGNSYEGNGSVDIIWMYIDIIPKDWDLGPEEYPRKWLFAVAGDRVIISAQEVNYTHGRTPVVVSATNFDGYSATPVSKLSMVHDIQTLINFMYTSHVHNVRKSLNDMFLIDPSIINYYDIQNPQPGKIIRTRRAAWGKSSLDQAFKQLQVNDVTQQHVGEANALGGLMRRISATDGAVSGGLSDRTTRISAREAGGAIGSALNRFQKNAQLIDMQVMQPLAMLMASHTQQFMEEETYVKVAGDWIDRYMVDFQDTDGRLRISPFDIQINYDVMPTNGNIPGSEDPQVWTQLFQIASQNPVLLQQTDWMKLFKHIGRNLGAKNVDEFIVRVQPDEEIARQQQQGNLVPQDE